MKFFPSILLFASLTMPGYALETADIAAQSAKFASASGDDQYTARIEQARLVDQATLPSKGDPAATTKVLAGVLLSADTSPEAKKYLLRDLARVGTPDAIAAISPLLDDANPMLRDEARSALQLIPDPKALAALQSALGKAKDTRGKAALADALATQKVPSSISLLAPLALDSDQEVFSAALLAIAKIGGAGASKALNKALASNKVAPARKADFERAILVAAPADSEGIMKIYQSTKSETIQSTAFLLLMKSLPAKTKSTTIEGALKSENLALRQQAIIAAIHNQVASFTSSLAANIGQMPKEDRLIVLANIHLLKPAAKAEKIALAQMESKDMDELAQAISALGRIATKPAFDAVVKALALTQPQANQAAAVALANMKFPAAESALLTMLKGSSEEKILAFKAMLCIHVTNAGNVLTTEIKAADSATMKEAMKSLYFIATIDDLRSLCALATATKEAEVKSSLSSLCTRIATRLNTDEARELVKSLG